MDTDQKEFLIREYDRLTVEIADALKETQRLERISLIGSALILTWALSQPGLSGFRLIMWIPFVLVILGALRSLGLLNQMRSIGKYIRRVEKLHALPDGHGWENSGLNEPLRVIAGIIFWIVLITGSILLPIHYEKLL
jgi:hypothetical protein